MSRSYKKHPWRTDGNSAKVGKKFANRRVRNTDFEELTGKGGDYKKKYQQYDIRDWEHRWTWEEAVEYYRQHPEQYKEYPTEEDFYRYWYKLMKMK